MTEQVFWQLMTRFDKSAKEVKALVEPVVVKLAEMGRDEVFSFEEHLAEKLFRLDGEEWARRIGDAAFRSDREAFSVDMFLYARCVVVASGREFYESVLANPKQMPKNVEFEDLLSIGSEAWERLPIEARGTDPEYVPKTTHSYETFSNEEGWR